MNSWSAARCRWTCLVVFGGVLGVTSPAAAGPYASSAMGEGVRINFPVSVHAGGTFLGTFGRTQGEGAIAYAGEGFLELHLIDFLTFGAALRSQALPALSQPLGTRANTVRARLRLRVPLARDAGFRRTFVPLVSLGIDVGGGWLRGEPPDVANSLFTIGAQLRFEAVLVGRVTVYVPLGYDRLRSGRGNLRQFETGLGIMVRLGGDTLFGRRSAPVRAVDPAPESDRPRLSDRDMDRLRRAARHLRDRDEEEDEDEDGAEDGIEEDP